MSKAPPSPRRHRRRRDGIAHWQWRDGRPRWIPAPALRAQGWRGLDLKDGQGRWLSDGASRDRAAAINAAVADWRAGRPVPPDLRSIAPAGSWTGAQGPARPSAAGAASGDPLAMGRLIDDFLKAPGRSAGGHRSGRSGRPEVAGRTVAFYAGGLKRLVDALAGHAVLPARDDAAGLARYSAAVAEVRALSVLTLAPYEARHEGRIIRPLAQAYDDLLAASGPHAAAAALRSASRWLGWCGRHRSLAVENWAASVEKATPPGRVATWTLPQIAAVVRAADDPAGLDMPWVADLVILCLDLSWNPVEIVDLSWDRITTDGRALPLDGRQKTGKKVRGGTPLLEIGRRRIEAIGRRQSAMTAHPTLVIHRPRQRRPSRAGRGLTDPATQRLRLIRDDFRQVLAHVAALPADQGGDPAVLGLRLQDLRDTLITLAERAGVTDAELATRTHQSLANMAALKDRHYLDVTPDQADRAKVKLDDLLAPMVTAAGL